MIKNKEITCLEVIQIHINHIKMINPLINAVVKDNFENSINRAKDLDKFIIENDRKILDKFEFLGVPFSVKESIKCEGMPNTSGLYSRKNRISKRNAEVVENMINAGGIPICVTNTSEICMW